MRRVLLLIAFTSALSVPAKGEPRRGKPGQFQVAEQTDQELEATRVRARHRITTWREAKPEPQAVKFPWMQVGFTLLALAIAAPFAWSSYRGTAEELTNGMTFRGRRRRRAPEDD